MLKALTLTGFVSLAAVGCVAEETMSSEDIRTGGIAATIEVWANSASQSTAKATLQAGGDEGNVYVVLDNGDVLRATAAGTTQTMRSTDEGRYEASFAVGAADTEFKIELDRNGDDDALNNVGLLPAPFDITAPTDVPSRANNDITISWAPSGTGDSMRLEIDGPCIFMYNKSQVSDTGSYSIPKGELDSTGGSNPETCDLTVTMKRIRGGSVDAALDRESSFELRQQRAVKFSSAP